MPDVMCPECWGLGIKIEATPHFYINPETCSKCEGVGEIELVRA